MRAYLKTLQKKTVTAGTRVALNATSKLVRNLRVTGLDGNTDAVYLGDVTTSATVGLPMAAGDVIDFVKDLGMSPDDQIDLADLYIDSAVNAEGVAISWLDR